MSGEIPPQNIEASPENQAVNEFLTVNEFLSRLEAALDKLEDKKQVGDHSCPNVLCGSR